MKRRDFLAASAATFGFMTLSADRSRAAPDEIGLGEPVQFQAGTPVPTLEELLADKGTAVPYRAEVEKAKKILAACPEKKNPSQVAQYFSDLQQGEFDESFGNDAHLYACEWPVRANPVIITFFDATTLRTPEGDQTAWCAAFVNWCIVQGHKGRKTAGALLKHTASAASATFRSWGEETDKPTAGDIVVFEHKRDHGRGHVGFFVSETESGIYVLGGNQMPLRAKLADGTYERRNTGEVNIKRMPRDGADLKLHSYRTDVSLHDLTQ